jgi:hypothetical protein
MVNKVTPPDIEAILRILTEQRLLIENFIKTGNKNLVIKFKVLSEEFQQIHQERENQRLDGLTISKSQHYTEPITIIYGC